MNNVKAAPRKYSQYPNEVKRRIKAMFEHTLKQYPYPAGIEERIIWIHTMEEVLKTIEIESSVLYGLEGK